MTKNRKKQILIIFLLSILVLCGYVPSFDNIGKNMSDEDALIFVIFFLSTWILIIYYVIRLLLNLAIIASKKVNINTYPSLYSCLGFMFLCVLAHHLLTFIQDDYGGYVMLYFVPFEFIPLAILVGVYSKQKNKEITARLQAERSANDSSEK